MTIKEHLRRYLPESTKHFLRRYIKVELTRARKESNIWLRRHAADIQGHVLSIGSGNDEDNEGGYYRNYFKNCSSYKTSEVTDEFNCDMVIDVRSMPEIEDESFDCVYCSGVLEHVDNHLAALDEITRILKPGGILLLGLPFRQAIHLAPTDYWRFTEFGIRHMLRNDYKIIDLTPIDNSINNFPAAYWVKAEKI